MSKDHRTDQGSLRASHGPHETSQQGGKEEEIALLMRSGSDVMMTS